MHAERAPELSPRLQLALAELQGLISQRYPDATFHIIQHPESAGTVVLKPVVDVEDRDAVMDTIIDRLVELHSEERLSICVAPIRPTARNEAIRRAIKNATAR